MKYLFTIFLFSSFPLLLFGQFEWVNNNYFLDEIIQLEKTEANQFAIRHNQFNFFWIASPEFTQVDFLTILDSLGKIKFERQSYIDYPEAICSFGTIAALSDSSLAMFNYCSSYGWGSSYFSVYDDNWEDVNGFGGIDVVSGNEIREGKENCLVTFTVGQKSVQQPCEAYYGFEEYLAHPINDISVFENDSLAIATAGGLEIRDKDAKLDTIYAQFIFDRIKRNKQNQFIGLNNDTISLLSADLKLIAKNPIPQNVKDFNTDNNKVAVLTENNHVYLLDDTLGMVSDFQLTEDSEFKFIHFNNSSIVMAGNERYGTSSDYKGNTSPFLKEYNYDGSTNDFGMDAGVTNFEYDIEVAALNNGEYRVRFKNFNIEVENFGTDTIRHLDLRSMFPPKVGVPNQIPQQFKKKSFADLLIAPTEKVILNWDNMSVLYTYNPAGIEFELCIWTSHPNNHLDNNNTNDIFCENTLVNDHELFNENNMSISPNPANIEINIYLANNSFSNNKSIKIINILGEVVFSKGNFWENELKIDCTQFVDGIYFLEYGVENNYHIVEQLIISHN